jgi:hypothetical protein
VRTIEEFKDDKKTKVIYLSYKLEVLDKLDGRMSITAFRCHYGMQKSIVWLAVSSAVVRVMPVRLFQNCI